MSAISTPLLEKTRTEIRDKLPGRVIAVAAITTLAFLPLLIRHGMQLWLKPHYQLFPIVIAGAVVLLWPALKWFSVARAGNTKVSFGLVAASWLFLAVAILFYSPTIAMAGWLLLLASVPIAIGGTPLLVRCLPALGLLLLIVPPPLTLDGKLVIGLQRLMAWFSSRLLDFVGVYHSMAPGTVVINIAGKAYLVEEACSGIHSLLSVLACTLFYVLWFKIHWLRATLLMLAAVFWVLIANVIRVFCITYFGSRFGINLGSGWKHEVLGILLFGLALALLFSTDRFLMFLGNSDPLRPRTLPPSGYSGQNWRAAAAELFSRPAVWFRSLGVAGAFGLLLLPQAAEFQLLLMQVPYSGSAMSKFYSSIDASAVPAAPAGWKFEEFKLSSRGVGNPFGEFSREWHYKLGSRAAVLSLDYPYPEWHDLRMCYYSGGWGMVPGTLEKIDHDGAGGRAPYAVAVGMHKGIVDSAAIWFCNFDQFGKVVLPSDLEQQLTPAEFGDRVTMRFTHMAGRWKRLFEDSRFGTVQKGSVLQVQLLVQGFKPLDESEKKLAQDFFMNASEVLRKKCIGLLPK